MVECLNLKAKFIEILLDIRQIFEEMLINRSRQGSANRCFRVVRVT